MKKNASSLFVLGCVLSALFACGPCWAQTPPSLLVVVRAGDDSLWKMTCDDLTCTSFSSFPGMFRTQPAVTWDETAQEWVVAGTAADYSIWMATFDKNGNFNNNWQSVPGATPSPAGVSGGPSNTVTRTVNCPTDSLQAAIDSAKPGDIINVTGTCNENISVKPEKHRITIDGGNVATINGLESTKQTIVVAGNGIIIQNFAITGGRNGIQVWRNGSATIINNNIHNTGSGGILVTGSAFSTIKNNNIHDNPGDGIFVSEASSAHIGFDLSSDASPSPNTIQNNGGNGIRIFVSSDSWIVGNTISGNTGWGISVERLSHALTASNLLNSNNGGGIHVLDGSGLQLGENNPVNFFQQPNITTVNNTGYGIRCGFSGYVKGHLGSSNQLNGTLGQTYIDPNCAQELVTP